MMIRWLLRSAWVAWETIVINFRKLFWGLLEPVKIHAPMLCMVHL